MGFITGFREFSLYLFIFCLSFFKLEVFQFPYFGVFLYFEIVIYFIIDFVDWVHLFVYVYDI